MSKNIFIEKESDSVYFVRLKKEYYSPDAVIMTANMFTDKCYVKIDELPDDYVGVWFKLKYEINAEKVQQLLSDYCNEVLEKQIQLDLENRFGNLREIVYKKAFLAVGGVEK